MVLAPHPDDESLATGGVLQAASAERSEVRVLFITDGENNPWAQRAVEKRWHIGADERSRWGRRRRQEAIRALAVLGVDPSAARFLGCEDQHLSERLLEGAGLLHEEIESWRPTVLIVPSVRDRHPDHNATAILTQVALLRLTPDSVPCRILEYVVHPPSSGGAHPRARVYVPTRAERASKLRAILCHASQLTLRRRFLTDFADRPEVFDECRATRIDGEDSGPLHALHPGPGQWSFAVRRSFRTMLGGAALLLVLLSPDDSAALQVELPLGMTWRPWRGRAPGAPMAEVVSTRRGRDIHVRISTSPMAGERVFVKLMLPRERRLGMFDRWSWQSFDPATGWSAPLGRRPARRARGRHRSLL